MARWSGFERRVRENTNSSPLVMDLQTGKLACKAVKLLT